MTPEMLAKVQEVYDRIHSTKEKEKESKLGGVLFGGGRCSGKTLGISIVHNVTGKLGAILPIGMSATKLKGVVTKNAEKIEEFRNDTDNDKILKL